MDGIYVYLASKKVRMSRDTTPSEYLTEPGAAAYLGFTKAYLRKHRALGDGPPFIKIGRNIRYRRTDLEAWMEAHRIGGDA